MTGALIGVDLGGTSIRAAVATGGITHGTPVHRDTPAHDGPDAVLDAVADCVREVTHGETPAGLAIGIPGPLDPHSGVVHDAPNLAGWREVPAAGMLTQRLRCPVVICHDAAAAGYAEWRGGAGGQADHVLFITVSTGIGGALFIRGQLYEGAGGTAGEFGHTPIASDGPACRAGHRGCLEGSASGTAIAEAAQRELAAGAPTSLRSLAAATVDARAVVAAADSGDALARRLFADAGRALGRAVGGFINSLAPDVIVIGGGLINAGDLLFTPTRAAIGEIAFPGPAARCSVTPAALGTDAGLAGAVAWAVRAFATAS